MSDRQGPNGPKSNGPGQGPPRRGLFARNPFLVILLILAAVVMFNAIWSTGGVVELSYNQFKGYLRSMPTVNEGVLIPEDEEHQRRTAEERLESLRTVKASDDDLSFGYLFVTIRPDQLVGELKPRMPTENQTWEEANPNLPKGFSDKLKWGPAGAEKDSGTKKYRYINFVVEHHGKDTSLEPLLEAKGVKATYDRPTDWSTMLLWGLPLLFLVFIIMMMLRTSRMSGENVLAFGRSRAKIVGEDKTGVSFADVAGADEAKEELEEIVEFLKEPDRFTSLGGKIPKGVLLMGPPGCGKTLLARAVAGEAGVPFFSISGSDFVEMFVGVGAARVRDLFNTAKQKAPCIIFVDEIDAVGRHRGTGLGGGHDEREQTLNQLLVEMDGFDGRKGVIVIAATNRPDILDPALLRPGRFDRQVVLDAPDLTGRLAVLKIHSRGKPLAPGVDLEVIAKRTPGFSGADLANVMNEAALLSARRRRKDIGMKEVEEAVERVVAGPERRSRIINDREKKILAYHELGHAVVARFSPEADPVHKVSIIPRGKGALGYTLTLPDEDRYIITKEELLARIRVTMGGRSAEEVIFGHQSTGAEDDLQKCTQLARALVCRWGMNETLGPVTYERSPGNPFLGKEMGNPEVYSEETAAEIDHAVRGIVEACHQEALEIIKLNKVLIDRLADHLIEHEVLDLQEFEEAVQKFSEGTPPPLRADLARAARRDKPAKIEADHGPKGPTTDPEAPPLGSGPLPQGA
jgi:cell division protease FtsH